MLKQLGTWFVVGLPLLIGIAPYPQEGKWAAQGDQSAQSLINMERQWAEADCDGNLSIQQHLQTISKVRLQTEPIWTDTWLKRNGQWQIVAAQDNWAKTK